jgi:chromosome segregation ATPase
MPAFVLLSSAFLVFAVAVELLAFQYQPAALVGLFSSLPVSQQVAWLIICLVPLSLIAVVLLQHFKLIEKRKAGEVLETRLRSLRLDVLGLGEEQKNNEQAVQHLHRSDPEGAISALQGRIAGTEEGVQFHQERNQSGDLIGCLDKVRQQQQAIRQKLGEVIAKRRSIETSIGQLQSSQDEIDQSISVIEQDKDGETLDRRLQRLSQFIGTTSSRCEEIERSVPGLLELEEKFEALQRRLAPLEQKKTGVMDALRALSEVRNQIDATTARLERDEGVSLEERLGEIQKLSQFIETTNTRCEEIERSMPGLQEFEEKFEALQRRLAPLEQKKTNVIGTLAALSDVRNQIVATIARLERDEGVSLEERLGETQKLSLFIGTMSTRCEEIERSMPGLLELEEKFEALQRRLAPLEHKKNGVIGTLKALSDMQNQVNATIARLEEDEGVTLEDRIEQLAKTKHGLEVRVSSVLEQFSEIEAIHKDIADLFGKLNQARRMPREFDLSARVVSVNGNGADKRQGDTSEPSRQ